MQRLFIAKLDEQERAKRGPFVPPAMNDKGLAWADGTRARILIMRGEGTIVTDDMTITPHPYRHDAVEVQRPGGGTYAVTMDGCSCPARKKLCRHREAVTFAGGVEAIHKAYQWWKGNHDEPVRTD